MVCVYCGAATQVINSRLQKRNNQVWRRRKCQKCHSIFTTHELPELEKIFQVDKNGALVPFSADILFTEVLLALQDRKNCYSEARELTGTIISKLLHTSRDFILSAEQISRISAEVLKRFNRRGWLRYVAEHPSLQS